MLLPHVRLPHGYLLRIVHREWRLHNLRGGVGGLARGQHVLFADGRREVSHPKHARPEGRGVTLIHRNAGLRAKICRGGGSYGTVEGVYPSLRQARALYGAQFGAVGKDHVRDDGEVGAVRRNLWVKERNNFVRKNRPKFF